MFTLLLRTAHGWTDALGHGASPDANQWPTEEDARAAILDLTDVGIGTDPGCEWRVVDVADLGNYILVA